MQGNVSKRGVLIFSKTVMNELGISPEQLVCVARNTARKNEELYLILCEDSDKAIRFSRVGRAVGLMMPSILDELIPDFETTPYHFQLSPVDDQPDLTFQVSFKRGTLHL